MTTKLVQIPMGMFKVPIDADGNPLVGGKVYTYAAGTTNKIVTYTDSSGLTQNTNPIILDARGECNIWVPALDPIDTDSGPPGPPGPAGPQGPPGTNGLLSVTVTLTSAQLKALNVTKVLLLAGQGAGTEVLPMLFAFKYHYGTVAYTDSGGGNFSIFCGSAGDSLVYAQCQEAIVTPSVDQFAGVLPSYQVADDVTKFANLGIYIACDQALTLGDGTLDVTMWYEVKGSGSTPTTIVSSVTNADGSLIIAPTTGDVVASWSPIQIGNVNAKLEYQFYNVNPGVAAFTAITVAADAGPVDAGVSLLSTSSGLTPAGVIIPTSSALIDNTNQLAIIQNHTGPMLLVTGGDLTSNVRMRIMGADSGGSKAGNIRVGDNTNPTARLDIKAGTATAGTAPVKLHTGPLLTTPEAGAIESLGDKLYFTIPTGPTRKEIPLGTQNGVISIKSEQYLSNSGTLFTFGTYNFGSHPVTFTYIIDYDPNVTNVMGWDISNGRLVFNANCIMSMSATLHGEQVDSGLPTMVTLALSHTNGTDLYGNSAFNPVADLGSEVVCNVTTGPIQVTAGDQWDANFILAGDNSTFSRITIKQLLMQGQVLVLL